MLNLLAPPTRAHERDHDKQSNRYNQSNHNHHSNIDLCAEGPTLYLILEAVDMRLGIDGLSRCVETRLERSACTGDIYVFSNARRNRLKLLLWDATGVWLAQRRLHQGRFTWWQSAQADHENQDNTHITLSVELWHWLTQGLDWHRLNARAADHAHWRVG